MQIVWIALNYYVRVFLEFFVDDNNNYGAIIQLNKKILLYLQV